MNELEDALKSLKNKRCRDTLGLVAEMLKYSGSKLKTTLLSLYNEILQPNAMIPKVWQHTAITVLHKS
eukprot:7975142-Karenia_brevis.AAC.1